MNRKLGRLLFVLFFSTFANHSLASQEVLMRGQAVFRLNQQVYFVHDLAKHFKALQTLNCLFNEDSLLKILNMDISQDQKTKAFVREIIDFDDETLGQQRFFSLSEYRDFMTSFVDFLMMRNYANRFRLSMDREEFEKIIQNTQCGVPTTFANWSLELRSMFNAYVYLQNRFSSEVWVADLQQKVEVKTFIANIREQFDFAFYF